MPESVQSCFELSIHFPVFFSRELFLERLTSGSLTDKCMGSLSVYCQTIVQSERGNQRDGLGWHV